MSSHHNTASRDRFVRKPCTPCYFGQSTQFRGCIPQKWNAVGQSREDERERTLDFRKNCRLRSVLDLRVLVLLNSDLSRLLPSLTLSLSLSLSVSVSVSALLSVVPVKVTLLFSRKCTIERRNGGNENNGVECEAEARERAFSPILVLHCLS